MNPLHPSIWRTGLPLALAVFSGPQRLAAQWTDVNDPPVDLVRGMYFSDANTGVICGDGSIQRTTDGGETWQTVASFPQQATDLDFTPDGVHGICGLTEGLVLVSHDTGLTWTSFAVDGASAAAWEVDISNGQTLFADMYLEPTFFSTDGGETWAPFTPLSNFQEMHFLDANNGFCCTLNEVYRTTDGGLTWTLVFDDFPASLKGIVFTDLQQGWVAGGDGYIARTTNGGVSWTQQYLDEAGISTHYCIDVDASGLGVAGSNGQVGTEQVLFTTNGSTWTPAPFTPTTSTWACSVPAGDVAYTCAYDGDLWRYAITLGVREPEPLAVHVAPVPASGAVQVQLPASDGAAYTLVLVDHRGRTVHTQRATAGTTWLAPAGLAQGLYSLQVLDGERICAVRPVIFE